MATNVTENRYEEILVHVRDRHRDDTCYYGKPCQWVVKIARYHDLTQLYIYPIMDFGTKERSLIVS